MKHIRLLPALILVSALSFTVRLGDFFVGLSHSGSAMAQQEVSATPPAMSPEAAKTDDKKADDKPAEKTEDAPPSDPAHVDLPAMPDIAADKKDDTGLGDKWKDPGDAAMEESTVRADLYKDLAKRRDELDKREKELNVREALLKAGEKEVEGKLKQLTDVRNEIRDLLKQEDEQEQQKLDSLVKIYENMKPDDAARIMNTLDMDVVMKVIGHMSERKSSLIIAAMAPERARQVTQLLAQQKAMPEIPGQ